MNTVLWSPTLCLSPLQFDNIRSAFSYYSDSLLNKFVPELNGLLLKVDKSSLKIQPAAENLATGSKRTCLVQLLAEQPQVFVRTKVVADVFRPVIGQLMEARVTAVKPQFIVCRYGGEEFSVYITVPRFGGENVLVDAEGKPSPIFEEDTVSVEVAEVQRTVATILIRGKLVAIVERGTYGKKQMGMLVNQEKEEEQLTEPVSSKKRKSKKLDTVDAEGKKPKKKKKKIGEISEAAEELVKKKVKKRKSKENEANVVVKQEPIEEDSFFDPNPTAVAKNNADALIKTKREADADRIFEHSPDLISASDDDIATPTRQQTKAEAW